MTEPAIQIKNATKIYGHNTNFPVKALEDVSLTIEDNEFFTLLGPSGCGKTTLLRLVAGFEYPTSGEILLFGKNLEGLPPQERPVNTVFQHYALFPHMSVGKNVGFGLKMLGREEKDINKIAMEMLDLVQMKDFVNRQPHQLSGGQQQRVALARALASRPKVLLLDEPLSALDLKLRHEMREELKTLQKDTGITFIFVTHDQVEALTMSDRIAVMTTGRLQQTGTPTQIYEQPRNRFVADFIGESNFIEAVVTEVTGDYTVCTLGENLVLSMKNTAVARVDDRVTLALRPEKITINALDAHEKEDLIGTVENSIYLGTDTAYQVRLNKAICLNVRGKNSISGEAHYQIKDKVALKVAPGAARILAEK